MKTVLLNLLVISLGACSHQDRSQSTLSDVSSGDVVYWATGGQDNPAICRSECPADAGIDATTPKALVRGLCAKPAGLAEDKVGALSASMLRESNASEFVNMDPTPILIDSLEAAFNDSEEDSELSDKCQTHRIEGLTGLVVATRDENEALKQEAELAETDRTKTFVCIGQCKISYSWTDSSRDHRETRYFQFEEFGATRADAYERVNSFCNVKKTMVEQSIESYQYSKILESSLADFARRSFDRLEDMCVRNI